MNESIGPYFVGSHATSDSGYALYKLENTNIVEINTGSYTVSNGTTLVLLNDLLLAFDQDGNASVAVINLSNDTLNAALSLKATNHFTNSGFSPHTMIAHDNTCMLITEDSLDGWSSTYRNILITLNANMDIVSTRVLSTHNYNDSPNLPYPSQIYVLGTYLYEFYLAGRYDGETNNYIVMFKRYNLTTSAYDTSWGGVEIIAPPVLYSLIDNYNYYTKLTSLNGELVLLDPDAYYDSTQPIVYINAAETDSSFTYKLTTVTEEELEHGYLSPYTTTLTRVFSEGHLLDIRIDYPEDVIGSSAYVYKAVAMIDGDPVDVTENFTTIDFYPIKIVSLQVDKLTLLGIKLSEMFSNHPPTSGLGVLTSLSFDPNIIVTKIVDYYAKAATFHKAIISPNGKVYVPADAEVAKFISIAVDNNNLGQVFWFNNETEEFESKVDLLLDYNEGLNFTIDDSLNDIIVMWLHNGEQDIYKTIGVNTDGSLTDISSLIAPNFSTAMHQVYAHDGIIALSQNEGQYQLTFNPETDDVLVNLGVSYTGYNYSIEKLSEDWYAIHEQDIDNYTVIKILVQWSNPRQTGVDNVIDLTEVYTSSDQSMFNVFRLLRTIPGSTEYFDINVDYPLLPGLYANNYTGLRHVVFNGDPEMYSVNDLIDERADIYKVHGLVDSSTRKILVCTYSDMSSISFFDVDTQEFIEPSYISPEVTLEGYEYAIYNNVHELSDGSFIAKVDNYVFTSPDLLIWTRIIGVYQAN